METTKTSPVSFSAGAIEELKRLMQEAGFESRKELRIGVKGGGCSGLSYVLEFDERKPGDVEMEYEGLPFLLNPAHEIYLHGMEKRSL